MNLPRFALAHKPIVLAIALLLLWVGGDVPSGTAPPTVASWYARRAASAGGEPSDARVPAMVSPT